MDKNDTVNSEVDKDLAPIRAQIDAVDAQLLNLLNERTKLNFSYWPFLFNHKETT